MPTWMDNWCRYWTSACPSFHSCQSIDIYRSQFCLGFSSFYDTKLHILNPIHVRFGLCLYHVFIIQRWKPTQTWYGFCYVIHVWLLACQPFPDCLLPLSVLVCSSVCPCPFVCLSVWLFVSVSVESPLSSVPFTLIYRIHLVNAVVASILLQSVVDYKLWRTNSKPSKKLNDWLLKAMICWRLASQYGLFISINSVRKKL